MSKHTPMYPFVAIIWEKVADKVFTATHCICTRPGRRIQIEHKEFYIESPVAEVGDYDAYLYVPEKMGGRMIGNAYDLKVSAYVNYKNDWEHWPYMRDFPDDQILNDD